MIQWAVKDITEGEEQSKNVIIFGLKEQDEENVKGRVSEIFEVVGGKPRLETESWAVQRQLETQLKEQAAEDKSRRYFTRNGQIKERKKFFQERKKFYYTQYDNI